jgi:hypothetical protein
MNGIDSELLHAELPAVSAAPDARQLGYADGASMDKSTSIVIVGGCGTFGKELYTPSLRKGKLSNNRALTRPLDCLVASQSRLHERPVS